MSNASEPTMPFGASTSAPSRITPYTTSLYSFAPRNVSGSSVNATAPITDPHTEPRPPTAIKVICRNDAEISNSVGSMKPTTAVNNPPASPAKAAAMENANSLVRPGGIASACATITLCRTASKARP